ncbi:MAG: hypothetical protein IIA03_08610 [Proteobacteria bacterium]|nr:hypothetical protein [Pseudomonadota bacterium]
MTSRLDKTPGTMKRWIVEVVSGLTCLLSTSMGWAHGGAAQVDAPKLVAVRGQLPPLPTGVAELRFGDIFKLPVGPTGLEPSERLRELDGKTVRMVGYVASTESPAPGMFILSPLPVSIGGEDESLSDDLPPSAVFVHLQGPAALRGLIQVTGVLNVGAQEEPDGRVSSVRLVLSEAASRRYSAAPVALRKRGSAVAQIVPGPSTAHGH